MKRKKGNKLVKINFMLFMLVIFANVIFSSGISAMSYHTGLLETKLNKQSNKNQSLTMKINELASPENVQLVAQNLGLEYNNNNIRTITE